MVYLVWVFHLSVSYVCAYRFHVSPISSNYSWSLCKVCQLYTHSTGQHSVHVYVSYVEFNVFSTKWCGFFPRPSSTYISCLPSIYGIYNAQVQAKWWRFTPIRLLCICPQTTSCYCAWTNTKQGLGFASMGAPSPLTMLSRFCQPPSEPSKYF